MNNFKLLKIKTILFFSFWTASLFAINLEIVGPCKKEPLVKINYEVLNIALDSVGQVTIDIFDKYAIPYFGGKEIIKSIFDMPHGNTSIEIIGEGKYRIYGWCYMVDDFMPEENQGQVFFTSNENILTWFLGYSILNNGEWESSCEFAYEVKPKVFCSQ